MERVVSEHHQILLAFKESEERGVALERGGAEQADYDDGIQDLADDPLLIKIAVRGESL